MNSTKLGRNEKCWCNSGLKFKKCHLGRERQEKDSPWPAIETNKRRFQEKKCCAAGGALGACEGRVIQAHTVSRGPNLTKIARNGHVIHYSGAVKDFERTGGHLRPTEIGISQASAFNGFCSKHDRLLFSCIENEAFVGRADQCLASSFRILSREMYGKNASSHIRETLRNLDKGSSIEEQRMLQGILDEIQEGNEAARAELSSAHALLTQALATKQPAILRSLVIECESSLPFMVAGAWSPFTDLYGHKLQDGLAGTMLEQIFLSTFAGDGGSYLCVSWIDKADAPGKVVANQIDRLPLNQQTNAFLQIAVKHIENAFFEPNWFEALSDGQRKQLDQLAFSGVDFLGSIPAAPIDLRIVFPLPNPKSPAALATGKR